MWVGIAGGRSGSVSCSPSSEGVERLRVTRRVSTAHSGSRRSRTPGPVRLEIPADFDFDWAHRFLTARMVPAIEVINADGLERVVWLEPTNGPTPVTGPVALAIQYRASSVVPGSNGMR